MSMRRLSSTIILLLLAMVSAFAAEDKVLGGKTESNGDNSLIKAFRHGKMTDQHTMSMSGGKKKKSDDIWQKIQKLGRDEVFLDISGHDILRWGVLLDHLDALDMPFNVPAMRDEGMEVARKIAYKSRLGKLIGDYIRYGVIAVEARRLGLHVKEEEFVEQRKAARETYGKMGDVGIKLTKLLDAPESFFEHNLTNALLWRAYKTQIVEPTIQVSNDEIHELIKIRHQQNSDIMATNMLKVAQIKEILSKVRRGMDFGDAAETWSEDDYADSRGIITEDDDDEVPKRFGEDDLPDELEAASSKLAVGEISDIIETPYAWHIIKLLKRNPATDENEATVELAQIMLEKEMLEPEINEAQAEAKIRLLKVNTQLKLKFVELLRTTKVDCQIPLSEKKGEGPSIKVKRL